MKKLEDFANVQPPDSDYPYGQIKDESTPGANDNTPMNVETFGDMYQFFARMFDKGAQAGLHLPALTANGEPDNATNGFQYFQAFMRLARPYASFACKLTQSGSGNPTAIVLWSDFDTGTLVLERTSEGVYVVDINTGTDEINEVVCILGSTDVLTNSHAIPLNSTTFSIRTYEISPSVAPADGYLSSTFFEVRRYLTPG